MEKNTPRELTPSTATNMDGHRLERIAPSLMSYCDGRRCMSGIADASQDFETDS